MRVYNPKCCKGSGNGDSGGGLGPPNYADEILTQGELDDVNDTEVLIDNNGNVLVTRKEVA